jgi:predicted RNase H-like HicB family nuclease
MITEYVKAAMSKAHYEILSDKSFYGEIPEFSGVYANTSNLETCRDELAEALEEWIMLRIAKGLSLPTVDGNSRFFARPPLGNWFGMLIWQCSQGRVWEGQITCTGRTLTGWFSPPNPPNGGQLL